MRTVSFKLCMLFRLSIESVIFKFLSSEERFRFCHKFDAITEIVCLPALVLKRG